MKDIPKVKNQNLLLDFIKHLGNVEKNWSAEHYQKKNPQKFKSNDFFFSQKILVKRTLLLENLDYSHW